MKKAFTLVELMVTVAVIAILMSFVLRFGSLMGDSEARATTLARLQRLENAISGYYAAFGTYPPVANFNSPNIYLRVDDRGAQSEDEENTALWGWLSEEGKVSNPGAEKQAWEQVKAACESQPVACAYPYREDQREYVEYYSEVAKAFAEQADESVFRDFPGKREVFLAGFDIGIPSGRFSQVRDKLNWADIKLFKFGLLSFLLPRYLFMIQCPQDMLTFKQWTGNNTVPSSPFTGNQMNWDNMWQTMENEREGNGNARDMAEIANIPSQAVCARWMPNFEKQLSCTDSLQFFGIDVKAGDAADTINYDKNGRIDINLNLTIYSPRGYGNGSTDGQYVLNTVTMQDGWGNEFFYYSAEPFQSYRLWSAGPNGRTFPPWINREKLDSDAQKCTGYWIQDDIVGLRN